MSDLTQERTENHRSIHLGRQTLTPLKTLREAVKKKNTIFYDIESKGG